MSQRMLMGLAAAAAVVIATFYFFSPSGKVTPAGPSSAGNRLSELMAPGPLPEITVGNKQAKITMIEYASLSCPACAHFHNTIYPTIKKKYIDTGKVFFILREYPTSEFGMAAAMLARCIGNGKEKSLIEDMFKRQRQWLTRENTLQNLFNVVKQAGFTQKSFQECIQDKPLYQKIAQVRAKASERFGVNGTPSFFINGEAFPGRNLAAFENKLEGLLKK